MKLFSLSSSSSSSTSVKKNKKSKKEKNKTPSISRSDPSSFNSTSSSDTSSNTVLPHPISRPRAYIGRNASCLDPEYDTPSDATASIPSSSYSSSSSLIRLGADGRFTCEELEQVFRRLGGKDEVSEILAEADRDGDGRISLDEFLKEKEEVEEDELRVAFGVYDTNGDGKISAEELFEVFRMLGDQECRIEDCRRMIGGVDPDGDGFVYFKDFAKMMLPTSDR